MRGFELRATGTMTCCNDLPLSWRIFSRSSPSGKNPSPVASLREAPPSPTRGEGFFKAWIFPVLYQCLAELPSLMLGSRLHIGNEIRLALPLISDIKLFCYCQRIIYFDAEIS